MMMYVALRVGGTMLPVVLSSLVVSADAPRQAATTGAWVLMRAPDRVTLFVRLSQDPPRHAAYHPADSEPSLRVSCARADKGRVTASIYTNFNLKLEDADRATRMARVRVSLDDRPARLELWERRWWREVAPPKSFVEQLATAKKVVIELIPYCRTCGNSTVALRAEVTGFTEASAELRQACEPWTR
jgi:hypothetical protein